MFTLTQLAGFVAVAEEQNFGRAAERLHMTQPPLTRQIQALERELKVSLFDRVGRGIRLTPAGQNFLSTARQLLHDAEAAALSVRRVSHGESGTVAIGFTAAAGNSFLGPLIVMLKRKLPNVDVILREMVTANQLDALSGGLLDLGLARPPITRPELESREVLSERLVVATPHGHRLSKLEAIEVGDLDGEHLIMYSPTDARYFYEMVILHLRNANVSVNYTQYLSQVHSILGLVRAGLGIALVPETASRVGDKSVVFRDLLTSDPAPVRLHAVWRRLNPNPALQAMLSLHWPNTKFNGITGPRQS